MLFSRIFERRKNGWLLLKTLSSGSHLWDDDVRQSSRQPEQLQRVLQAQTGVVDDVILHAVVDVGDLTDVIAAVLHAEVSL